MYICHAKCMYLLFSWCVRTTIYCNPPLCLCITLHPLPHNKHSNIQLQFLSLCRLQQLAIPWKLTVMSVSLLLATSAVIFWLWLVIVPAGEAILCPKECKCDTGGYYIICYGPSITSVPLIHLTDVRVLGLYENKITLFERDFFF